MKVVILAGGFGTRLSEETARIPKPMVEIGGWPMLWHIMNIYSAHGFKDFLIACGYRAGVIREYFANFHMHCSDLFVNLADGNVERKGVRAPDWRIGCIDTGLETMTGGRLLKMRDLLKDGPFMVTYGDGLADVNIQDLVRFHRAHGKLATVTAVRPPARFGALDIEDGKVLRFAEKPAAESGWINGGFFVFEPGVLDYIDAAATSLEAEPLARLAADGQLHAYRHDGFWKPMDTLREKHELEAMWRSAAPPWKAW
jgi:glucose-1-phosphate cytidylyltransferase